MSVSGPGEKTSNIFETLATAEVKNAFYCKDGSVARKEGKTITGLYHLIKFAEKINGSQENIQPNNVEIVRDHLGNIKSKLEKGRENLEKRNPVLRFFYKIFGIGKGIDEQISKLQGRIDNLTTSGLLRSASIDLDEAEKMKSREREIQKFVDDFCEPLDFYNGLGKDGRVKEELDPVYGVKKYQEIADFIKEKGLPVVDISEDMSSQVFKGEKIHQALVDLTRKYGTEKMSQHRDAICKIVIESYESNLRPYSFDEVLFANRVEEFMNTNQ